MESGSLRASLEFRDAALRGSEARFEEADGEPAAADPRLAVRAQIWEVVVITTIFATLYGSMMLLS